MGNISPEYVIGSVSLIFWTLMIITTLKYVVIAMQADNKHEGGIFALYALVRKKCKMVNLASFDWWGSYFGRWNINTCSNRDLSH